MKISYVTMQFPVPSETFASLDVNTLIKLGHEVSVHSLRFRHPNYLAMVSERKHDNIKIFHFNFSSAIRSFQFVITQPSKFLSLLFWTFKCCYRTPTHLIKSFVLLPSVIDVFQEIFHENPDVVHLFWGHYPSMVGHLVKRYMPSTTLSLFLGAHDLIASYPGSRVLSLKVDLMFTHSKENVPLISSMGIVTKNLHIIARGTNLDDLPQDNLTKFKCIDNPVLMTAARLIKDKGVDDVLKVFKGVLESNPNALLYVAGDGPYRSNLKDLSLKLGIYSNVIFIGHVDQDILKKYMEQSHIFLLMSRYDAERLPNVIKEAMYRECVVIATNTVGIEELVCHLEDGFVVPKGGIKTAMEYSNFCIRNKVDSCLLAKKAKAKIVSDFDVNSSMMKYLNLWAKHVKLKNK